MKPSNLALSRAIGLSVCFTLLAAAPTEARAQAKEDDDSVIYHGALFIPKKGVRFDQAAADALKAKFPDLPVFIDPPKEDQPAEALAVFHPTVEQFGLADEETLKYRGKGLSPEDRKTLTSAGSIWELVFVAPCERALPSLRRADQVMLHLAEATNGAIYEFSTRQYCARPWWKEHRIDTWDGAVPDVARFVTIDFYRNDDGRQSFRAISLGMSKFGLPDVVVNDMAVSYSQSMGTLMNLAMQTLVESGRATDEKGKPLAAIALDVGKVRHAAARKRVEDSLRDGAERKLSVPVAPAQREQGDPDGPILELTFAGLPGATPPERHEAAVSKLFGTRQEVVHVEKDDPEMRAASARAQQQLPALRQRFAKGLAFNERFIVKGPFKTKSGGSEYMWVEVTQWPAGELRGVLTNDPLDVPELKAGASVSVKEADVFDYVWYHADGTEEGGETTKIMLRRQGK